jgi:hypothetical protein
VTQTYVHLCDNEYLSETPVLCVCAAGPASAVILGSESRWTHDIILLSQIRDSPNLEGQVPVFIYPRNRVVRLYPQVLGSLFFASYDSQGYGGGIRPCLHTGLLFPLHASNSD